jgi:hypothetical protein
VALHPRRQLVASLEVPAPVVVVVTGAGEGGTSETAQDHRCQGDRDDRRQGPDPVGEPLPPGRRITVRREHAGARRCRLVAGLLARLGRQCRARLGRYVGHATMVRREPVFVL